jgi:hypothetical protein
MVRCLLFKWNINFIEITLLQSVPLQQEACGMIELPSSLPPAISAIFVVKFLRRALAYAGAFVSVGV